MVAAKAKELSTWQAWIGISLDHIRADIADNDWYDVDSLQEIPLDAVRGMEDFPHGEETVRRIAVRYGLRVPNIPGTTSYSLGRLTEVSIEAV